MDMCGGGMAPCMNGLVESWNSGTKNCRSDF